MGLLAMNDRQRRSFTEILGRHLGILRIPAQTMADGFPSSKAVAKSPAPSRLKVP